MNTPSHSVEAEPQKPQAQLDKLDSSIGCYVYRFDPDLTKEQATTLATQHGAQLTYRVKQALTRDGQKVEVPETVLQVPANMGLSRVLEFFDRINASGIAQIALSTEAYPKDVNPFADIPEGERLKYRVNVTAAHQVDPNGTGFVVYNPKNGVESGFIKVELPEGTSTTGAMQTLGGMLSKMSYADERDKTIVVERLF